MTIAWLFLAFPAAPTLSPAALPRSVAPSLQELEKKPDEPKRLERWPDLGKAESKVRTDVERLRKARTPEMAQDAEAALTATGAGIVPELLPALGREKDEQARERIERVLIAVTGAEHTRLLSAWFGDKAVLVRTFALRRSSAFPDPGLREAAEAALARSLALGEKADPVELYAAALCATSAGSLAGFDTLAISAENRWADRGAELRAVLRAVRGPEASALAVTLLAGERSQVVAGLNLLSGCGDRASVTKVKPFLDSDDNQIRVAAINALRGIVDGQGPIERLSVFEAIELAKKWKGRV